jgi:hypothetical protein
MPLAGASGVTVGGAAIMATIGVDEGERRTGVGGGRRPTSIASVRPMTMPVASSGSRSSATPGRGLP